MARPPHKSTLSRLLQAVALVPSSSTVHHPTGDSVIYSARQAASIALTLASIGPASGAQKRVPLAVGGLEVGLAFRQYLFQIFSTWKELAHAQARARTCIR